MTKCQGLSVDIPICIQDFVGMLRTCDKISVKFSLTIFGVVWMTLFIYQRRVELFPDFFVIVEQVQVECCVNWSAETAGQRRLERSQ